MRFLANENLPRATIQRLRDAGHDVFAVIDEMPGATDMEHLKLKGRFTVATRERLRQRPLPDDLE